MNRKIYYFALVLLCLDPVRSKIDIELYMKKAHLIPNLITDCPRDLLNVFWKCGELVPGSVLHPNNTIEQPVVTWYADSDALYALFLVALTNEFLVPYADKGNLTESYHWAVFDIPGSAIEKGRTFFKYTPPISSNRPNITDYYVFLVYNQKLGPVTISPLEVTAGYNCKHLGYVSVIAARHDFGPPKFANFFIVDDTTPVQK